MNRAPSTRSGNRSWTSFPWRIARRWTELLPVLVPPSEVEFDVVIVGAGAAGMVAALTAANRGLRAVVVEKAATFGGSTARSGGGIWLPGNEVLAKAGLRDS